MSSRPTYLDEDDESAIWYITDGPNQEEALSLGSKRWSLDYLKKKFREVDITDLYSRYLLRSYRWPLTAILLIFILYLALMIFIFALPKVNGQNATTVRVSSPISSGTGPEECVHFDTAPLQISDIENEDNGVIKIAFWIVFIVVCCCTFAIFFRPIYTRGYMVIGLVVWLCAVIIFNFPRRFKQKRTENNFVACDEVALTFYLIFVIYTMMPFSRRFAFVLGILSSATNLAVYVWNQRVSAGLLLRQVLANTIFHGCAHMVGFYHKHMSDLAHRQTFLDTRNFLYEDLKVNREKEWQSKRYEDLLRKIIPSHFLPEAIHAIAVEKRSLETDPDAPPRIHKLLIRQNDNVSILFADIVNFTQLAMKLTPHRLVATLHQLFSEFDHCAEKHNCLRIKLLGDCYYCVSGLPEPTPEHASNCVNMGMDMIRIIRDVGEATHEPSLGMRIGIHTGTVLSGVIGLTKWQYDVWSIHVIIANKMESTGQNGKIHITGTTKKCLNPKDGYEFEHSNAGETDELLKENQIATYFISSQKNLPSSPLSDRSSSIFSDYSNNPTLDEMADFNLDFTRSLSEAHSQTIPFADDLHHRPSGISRIDDTDDSRIRNQLADAFHLTNKFTEKENARHSERLKSGFRGMSRMTLRFKRKDLEKRYWEQADHTFNSSIMCALGVFFCVTFVQVLTLPRTPVMFGTFVGGMLFFASFLTAIFSPFQPENLKNLVQKTYRSPFSQWLVAMSSYVVTVLCSLITLNQCSDAAYPKKRKLGLRQLVQMENDSICLFPCYFFYSSMMAMVSFSVFLRLNHFLKTVLMFVFLSVYIAVVVFHHCDVFLIMPELNPIKMPMRSTIHMVIVAVTLFTISRQLEKSLRLDFLWKTRIQEEKDNIKIQQKQNQHLLENILPKHVFSYYSSQDRDLSVGSFTPTELGLPVTVHELYSQHHPNVCVMFASIPDYKPIAEGGESAMTALNEIIIAFDRILEDHQFANRVEKIKTIGSTYMCASGLGICPDIVNKTRCGSTEEQRQACSIVIMTHFAFEMRETLRNLAVDLQYPYRLQIGLNHGEVVAGVIGSQKPLYDIWGDTVNMASRMESHGESDKIQVPEKTANVLMKAGFLCEKRGKVKVKNHGQVQTYFVIGAPKHICTCEQCCTEPSFAESGNLSSSRPTSPNLRDRSTDLSFGITSSLRKSKTVTTFRLKSRKISPSYRSNKNKISITKINKVFSVQETPVQHER